jgi:hypothetical protein
MSLKLRCQQGFTTVTLMGVLLVGGLMVTAGYAAVDPDIGLSQQDADYKQAYAAAEAGLNDYLYHLGQDNNYFIKCDNVPPPNGSENSPVALAWTSGADTRTNHWRKLPSEKAEYSIELLPAKGYTKCEQNKQETMLDPSTGTIRVRVTGRVPSAKGGDDRRSIVATLRRKGFIDFLYFTDYETSDPVTYPKTDNTVGQGSAWASANCIDYRAARNSNCVNIQFADDDTVNGPLHSNDSILTCNTPIFGRSKNDAIEMNGVSPGYIKNCANQIPTFKGTPVWPGGHLDMPPSNQELRTLADPAYQYSGRTQITLTGNTMTVKKFYPNPSSPVTITGVPLPANGVIWVGSPACTAGYKRKQLYDAPASCGNVEISGNYSQELTIAAQNDIIVTNDLRRNSSGLLLGLVAQNFVRVYHPVNNWDSTNTDCDTNGGPAPDLTIEAAILAMDHSFIVDNYYCGGYQGKLNVDGAIAQRFRGPVGTGGSTGISNGYLKNYTYNDRLKFREPPFFIDPVQSSWRVARQTEQVPAK